MASVNANNVDEEKTSSSSSSKTTVVESPKAAATQLQQTAQAPSPTQNQQSKCIQCGKVTRKDCTMDMCVKCCTDENCMIHQQQRKTIVWKEQVLNGKTAVNLAAQAKRQRRLSKGRFKEPGFLFLGDTVIIWDIRQCLLFSSSSTAATAVTSYSSSDSGTNRNNMSTTTHQPQITSSVVEDILSRSRKRNRSKRNDENGPKVLRNNRKRFRRVIEDLYRQSLQPEMK